MKTSTLRTLALVAPFFATTPIMLAACSSAPNDGADVPNDDDGASVSMPSAVTSCKKKIYLHLANWTTADRLDDSRSTIRPNGCWGFNMAREYGHYWADCKGASNKGTYFANTWVDNWGSPSNWSGGPRMWTYDETAFTHTSPYPNDNDRIANCWSNFSSHWGVTPAKGYAYMMYQGSSGWDKATSSDITLNFAELYGEGNWWPYWSQWKANPVGRPMAQIAQTSDGANAYTVTKGLCEYVTAGNFMGLWVPGAAGALTYNSAAFKKIVQAMNDCTGS